MCMEHSEIYILKFYIFETNGTTELKFEASRGKNNECQVFNNVQEMTFKAWTCHLLPLQKEYFNSNYSTTKNLFFGLLRVG